MNSTVSFQILIVFCSTIRSSDVWQLLHVQGNKYFKEGKYVQAIDCYSRSIALQPTAVAFANRAMALLKIRR